MTAVGEVGRATGLAGSYYCDPALFDREMERIIARTWQLVGHAGQLVRPGDLLTARIGNDGVIVANDHGTLRAFHNVCQHRGHELVPHRHESGSVTGSGSSGITCPYHAWTYDLGGRLVHARGEPVGELCVPPVRVESLAGFLFVNLDPMAASLANTFPGVEDELLAIAPDAPQRVLSSTRTQVIEANWKLAVENYNECYHCPNVHKAFSAGVVSSGSYRITPRGFVLHHTAEGPRAERSAYAIPDEHNVYSSFYTWPVSSIQCYPGQVLNTFRWVPLAVDRTLLIRQWWFDEPTPTDDQQTLIELDWSTTVSEDFELMKSVQRGVAGRGYRPGPLITSADGVATVHSEDTILHLHALLRSALET